MTVNVERLDDERLGISVVVPLFLEFRFAFGKFLDDLFHRDRRRLGGNGGGASVPLLPPRSWRRRMHGRRYPWSRRRNGRRRGWQRPSLLRPGTRRQKGGQTGTCQGPSKSK